MVQFSMFLIGCRSTASVMRDAEPIRTAKRIEGKCDRRTEYSERSPRNLFLADLGLQTGPYSDYDSPTFLRKECGGGSSASAIGDRRGNAEFEIRCRFLSFMRFKFHASWTC